MNIHLDECENECSSEPYVIQRIDNDVVALENAIRASDFRGTYRCNSNYEPKSREEDQTMENIGREVDILRTRIDQMLRLMGHCKVEIPSDPSKAKELMKTALDLGGMKPLVEQCSKVIEENLNTCNAIEILKFASDKGIEYLTIASRNYILKNFMTVYQNQDLLTLSVGDLTWFLKNDELNVESEEIVFEALLRWVRFDLNKRKAHIEGLIACVRLYCCDIRFLKSLKDHYLLWDRDSFQRVLQPVADQVTSGSPEATEKAESQKRKPK